MFLKKTNVKVIAGIHELKNKFPFEIKSIDFDNGGEFINKKLIGYCTKENILFTRSRPYKKNDQAHIEGKNYQNIRKLLGYERIIEQRIVDLAINIYRNEERLLTNFFYPTLKLKEKVRVGPKVKKRYETAKTPYQRVMESAKVNEENKKELKLVYETLNPVKLQASLAKKVDRFNRLVSVSKLNLATPSKFIE